MTILDSLGTAIDRVVTDECAILGLPENLPLCLDSRFTDAFVTRVCERFGETIADGLMLQFAGSATSREDAQTIFDIALEDELGSKVEAIRAALPASALPAGVLSAAATLGFERRLNEIVAGTHTLLSQ